MIYESGIDALSFTFPDGHPDQQFLLQLVRGAIEVNQSEGNDIKNPAPHGFEGTACGGAFYGFRHGIYLVKLEGACSHDIARAITANRIAVKYTRCDVQVTYPQPLPGSLYTARLRRCARRAISSPGNPIPAGTRLFENPAGDDSYYLCNTGRTVVHRFYNKAARSPGQYPPDAWRSEHQVRNERAGAVMRLATPERDLCQLAHGINVAHLLRYGIDEPWMQEAPPVRYSPKFAKSDTAKRLEWCIGSAVPCLLKLGAAGVNLEAVLRPLMDSGYIEIVKRHKLALNQASGDGAQVSHEEAG